MNSQPIEKHPLFKHYFAAFFITVIVLTVLIITFIVNGSPFDIRDKNLDQRRINDFMSIKSSIESYYNQNYKLPSSLNDIKNYYGTTLTITDPDSKKEYSYIPKAGVNFDLCTVFSTVSTTDDNGSVGKPLPAYDTISSSSSSGSSSSSDIAYPVMQSYKHNKGYDCIHFTVNVYNYPERVVTQPATPIVTITPVLKTPALGVPVSN